MANINEILARAAALRDETALNSIDPERAGSIMYDTLMALNELWLQQGAALVISKIYASVAAMNADTSPVSDLTGQPLRPGQIVVIASSDSDNGSVYRYNGTSSPSWSLVGNIGDVAPVDSLDSDSTTRPLAAHQGKVLDGKISQLVNSKILYTYQGVYSGSSWFFNGFVPVPNKTYYVKLLSGEMGVLSVVGGSEIIGLSEYNKWVEITIPANASGELYIYKENPSQAPVLRIADALGVYGELLQINGKIDEINSTFDTNLIFNYPSSEGPSYTAFLFNGFNAHAGTPYYVKLISGTSGVICTTGNDGVELVQDEYVLFTPETSTVPYIYVGQTTGLTPPTIEVTAQNGLGGYIKEILDAIENIENELSIVQITSVENVAQTAFIYSGYPWVKDTKYYVKQISGTTPAAIVSGNGTDYKRLKLGEYVEYTPIGNDTPYWFTSTSEKTAPTIEVVKKDSIAGKIAELEIEKESVVKYTTINVARDVPVGQTGATGRIIDFSGLTAISDAINSITDASESNRYVIHIEGEFNFTDPLTVPMLGGGEYSIILMKKWVDIEGDGPDKSCISIDFPAGATFHSGKAYNDYQPIYFHGVGGNIRNMKIQGKNCRYAFHIEMNENNGYGETINIENCTVLCLGAPDYTPTGEMNCFGTGMIPGQTWNIKNCHIINYSNSAAFAMHTPLIVFEQVGTINFENCIFRGYINLHNYQVENNINVNLNGCSFENSGIPTLNYIFYHTDPTTTKHGNYTRIFTNANKLKALYNSNLPASDAIGLVLRVISKSTGVSSKVRFNPSSSAFNLIVGESGNTIQSKTPYCWNTQYGYVWRDGGVDLHGQAFGTIDIDEDGAAQNSLGKWLGDCSSSNKVLIINIDGTDYTITFNENYTSKNNAYVIGKINDVIGGVATASVFCSTQLYYPAINELSEIESADDGAILKGMGVVFTSTGMRRAKNSDGYIDGICIDDTSKGQTGRVICKGYIFSGSISSNWFAARDNISGGFVENATLGISQITDGLFEVGVSPGLLRRREVSIVEIINH